VSGDTYSFAPLRRGRQSGHRIPGAVGAALLALLTSTADASRAERRNTWPWALEVPAAVLVVYRPHIDAWKRNRLTFCAVVAAQATDSGEQAFGVIWGIARTTVDRPAGRVTLSALRLTRSNFPALLDNGVGHLRALQKQLKGVRREIALDRLEALAAESRHQAGRSRPKPHRPRDREPRSGRMV